MVGNIIYFSGTGNTEYISKLFMDEFKLNNIKTRLTDITKKRFITNNFKFLVLGAPVYADFYPRYFINWINEKIPIGEKRKVIIFTTIGAKSSSALNELVEIMKEKEYIVNIAVEFEMPNNYYLSNIFGRPRKEEIEMKKQKAKIKVNELVDIYISGNEKIDKAAFSRTMITKPVHNIFTEYSNTWAKKNLKVDMRICTRCNKCIEDCPTKNVSFTDKVEFKEECIYCLKCVNTCPVNAFLYKNNKVIQYKL